MSTNLDTDVNAGTANAAHVIGVVNRQDALLDQIEDTKKESSSISHIAKPHLAKLESALRTIQDIIQSLSPEDDAAHIRELEAIQQKCAQALQYFHEGDVSHLAHAAESTLSSAKAVKKSAENVVDKPDALPTHSAKKAHPRRPLHRRISNLRENLEGQRRPSDTLYNRRPLTDRPDSRLTTQGADLHGTVDAEQHQHDKPY